MSDEQNIDTAIIGKIVGVDDVPGKELARTNRTVHVIPEGAWTDTTLTVILPPPMSPLETLMAFVPLPEWSWHKWVHDVGDAVHDGDKDTVETLMALGLRKGFA